MRGVWGGWEAQRGLEASLASAGACETRSMPGRRWTSETDA